MSREDSHQRPEARQLLDQVRGRLRLAEFTGRWLQAIFGIGSLALIALLIRRFGGVGPDWLTAEALVGLPVVALLIAVLMSRKPTVMETARKIDTFCGASDLFLTLVQLKSSAGEYQSVIVRQADLRAVEIVLSEVVRWHWHRPAVRLSIGAGVLTSVVLFLPQFDPFGAVDSSMAAVAVRRDFQDSRRQTTARLAELSTKRESAAVSRQLDKSLAELAAKLQQFAKDRSVTGLQDLDARQREVEAQWREARRVEVVSKLLDQAQATQFFESIDQQSRQWLQELAKGQTQSLDKTFDALAENLGELADSQGNAERQQLEKQVRQAMAELQRFAGNQLQSQSIKSAMKRATSQLDTARLDPALRSEAIAAAKESLELARAEIQDVASDAARLDSLEKALGAIQSAKQLAQQLAQQNSPESTGKNESTIQEFVEQYAKLQGEEGKQASGNDQRGEKVGMSDSPGQQVASADGQSGSNEEATAGAASQGRAADRSTNGSSDQGDGRGAAKENDRAETAFRDARESLSLDESRRLLSMRRQGLSEAGEASEEYRKIVRSLQKRVSTAIEVEEIPPGYVSGIRRYFDSLDQTSQQDGPGKQNGPGGGSTAESEKSPVVDGSGEAADDAP